MTTTSQVYQSLSLNSCANPLVDTLINKADELRLGIHKLDNGSTIVDAGVDYSGGLEAGRRIAEICMAGLGSVKLAPNPVFPDWPWQVEVATSHPVLACLGSQYAGWSLSFKEDNNFFALGSGPGRSIAQKEPLFAELGYKDNATFRLYS